MTMLRSRLVSGRNAVERIDACTPYALEILLDDANHAGRGARLDVAVTGDADGDTLARLDGWPQRLAARGIHCRVRRTNQADLLSA
jgi:hypothetical protein